MAVSELLSTEFAAPFERTTEADAAALAHALWGLTPARAVRVDTERDDTFLVETAETAEAADAAGIPDTIEGGYGRYALKISHPADDPAVVELQLAAIEWAAARDAGLPLPHPIPALDGRLLPVADGRVARLSRWMPGRPLRDAVADAAPDGAPPPTLLHAVGTAQARLTVALEGFAHPADGRALAWDVARLPELGALLEAVDDPAPVTDAFDRFARTVAPRLDELPQQVIHNDGNLDNLLVSDSAPGAGVRVAAILDFGDVVRTARALDLAVAASYLVPGDGRVATSEVLAGLVAGWESVLPLEPLERELLPGLVVGRLVQRVLLGSWLARELRGNADYLGRNIAHTRAQLARALAEGS